MATVLTCHLNPSNEVWEHFFSLLTVILLVEMKKPSQLQKIVLLGEKWAKYLIFWQKRQNIE